MVITFCLIIIKKIDDYFNTIKINNDKCQKIINVLINSIFKNICLKHFKEEAELLSISIGCPCCS